jgi:DNA-nicking Smr family endonuclease
VTGADDDRGDPPPAEAVDPVVLPVTGELDLHAFAPGDAIAVVEDYLDECRRRGILDVRIVHGRGRGVRRAEVRRALESRADVRDFHDAPPASGGWGATLVVLAPLDAE